MVTAALPRSTGSESETRHLPVLPSLAERSHLVETHLPLVRRLASQFAGSYPALLEYEDLVAYGNCGLVEAAAKWQADRGVAFGAFAAQRIRGAMLDAMRMVDPLGRTSRGRLREIEAARSRLSLELGRTPNGEEIAQATGLAGEQVRAAEAVGAVRSCSFDAVFRADGGTRWEPEDLYAVDPEESAVRGDEVRRLRAALTAIPLRERTILSLRYVEGLTYAEIAGVMEVSPSRINQLERRALLRLRTALAG